MPYCQRLCLDGGFRLAYLARATDASSSPPVMHLTAYWPFFCVMWPMKLSLMSGSPHWDSSELLFHAPYWAFWCSIIWHWFQEYTGQESPAFHHHHEWCCSNSFTMSLTSCKSDRVLIDWRWGNRSGSPMKLLRTHVLAHGLAVRPWHTQGCLLYLVALLPLLFFRFNVLITVHLYNPL